MTHPTRRLVPLLTLIALLAGCQQVTAEAKVRPAQTAHASGSSSQASSLLATNDEPNLSRLTRKLNNARQHSVHIVQFGDSHTAADFFSGQLRSRLQERFGNGGIGFISPLSLPGQRYGNIALRSTSRDWTLKTSRRDDWPDFPLGGSVAQPNANNRTVALEPFAPIAGKSRVRLLYTTDRQNTLIGANSQERRVIALPPTKGKWGFSYPINLTLPASLSLSSSAAGTRIGGWYIDGPNQGVILSTLGSNGASLSLLERWRDGWQNQLRAIQPDMVILAYGTNEAFNDTLNLNDYRSQLQQHIRQIRRELPEAAIMLVGPGDSMKDRSGDSCGQTTMLDNVIRIQQEVARSEHAMYWDWRRHMGGQCSIKTWQARGDARPDFVHLTRPGYENSANQLYSDLMRALNLKP